MMMMMKGYNLISAAALVALALTAGYHVFVDHALSLEYVCQPAPTIFSSHNTPVEAEHPSSQTIPGRAAVAPFQVPSMAPELTTPKRK